MLSIIIIKPDSINCFRASTKYLPVCVSNILLLKIGLHSDNLFTWQSGIICHYFLIGLYQAVCLSDLQQGVVL